MKENKQNVKNKIIALSGQPVTGKGTTVKELIKKLKESEYKEENIHVIETGKEFRNYFESISEFIKSYNINKETEKISENPYLKSIATNKEYRKVLIDTIYKLKQNNINSNDLDIEKANNLIEFKELRKIVDTLIDTNIEKLGKEINKKERPNDVWIIDSRLAFHNIPEAFSIRLTSSPEIAAIRLFNDKSRGKEDNRYKTIEEAKEAREKRRTGEQNRYLKRYGVDLENEENYDLIINTSYSSTEDISNTILTCLNAYTEGKTFAKTWTSPKMLLPLQGERDTIGKTPGGYEFGELLAEIEKNGFMPDKPIEIIENEGYKYIIEGHHRNFCSSYLGKTLVPYKTIAKDDEDIPYYGGNVKQRANSLKRIYLWGHESFFEHNTKKRFSYDDIYPGIYDKLAKKEERGELEI